MRVEVDEHGTIVIKEAYVGVVFETAEGNRYGVSMRDDTIEILVSGNGPQPRVYPLATESSGDVYADLNIKPKHVCGLEGFGMSLDDVCPACHEGFLKYKESKDG